jgi:hypothetical protein
MSVQQEFKDKWKRFREALAYIEKNEEELKCDPVRWEKVKNNFLNNFEKPLDTAWNALDETQRSKYVALYLFRKGIDDEKVKNVMGTFNGNIVVEGEQYAF